ncbi:hypothetical protein KP509_22G035000 [Ceratopteris richardii]|uniref:Condensation domain-containing protein n=1 Tax=Ceratopteris richardii TaxID=49495 RepID=A0A8T2S3X2_CERRI|nr:hypothetical protein KP509_22G035000 [Ceratopteris richardii]
MSKQETDEALALLMNESPHSRMVGGTEYSWCKAVSGGTGTTVLAALFETDSVSTTSVQKALEQLQAAHPRLRSRLIWLRGRPALAVSSSPAVKLQVRALDELKNFPAEELSTNADDGDWLKLVEMELNMRSEWNEQNHSLEPQPMMICTLYAGIPAPTDRNKCSSCSLLALRLHTAICDRASGATILTELVDRLMKLKSESAGDITVNRLGAPGEEELQADLSESISLVPIEDAIPKGQADKPFWAHGLDILGYSLGSRRHAMIPFENVEQSERCSQIICKTLSSEDTEMLFKECKVQSTNRLGALTAAVLKAIAKIKALGVQREHHAVVTLLDCRHRLDPAISNSTVGFYHSALMNTHLVLGEEVPFWELARRCSEAVVNAIKRRKHFTDMGDVGLLMCQAIQMPQLTPWGSLRTSSLVVFEEALEDDASSSEARQSVGLVDYVGCSSVHGVGPSIAIFDTLRSGALHLTCVYPAPLHSRSQMNQLLDTTVKLLQTMA